MLNPFDEFDEPAGPSGAALAANPFDEFDDAPAPQQGVVLPSIKRTAGHMVESLGTTIQDITGPNVVTRGLRDFGGGVVRDNPSEIQSFGDVLEKPWTTVKEAVAEQVPQLGAAFTGARVGAAGGAALGSLLGPAGAAVGGVVGGVAGGLAPIFIGEYGEIRNKQEETGEENIPLALAGATGATALERLGLEKLATKAGMKGFGQVLDAVPEGASRVAHAGKQAVKTALVEGPGTEIPQTAIERFAGGQELGTPEALDEYAVAGAKGAVGGGAIGGGLGLIAPRTILPAPATGDETVASAATDQVGAQPSAPSAPSVAPPTPSVAPRDADPEVLLADLDPEQRRHMMDIRGQGPLTVAAATGGLPASANRSAPANAIHSPAESDALRTLSEGDGRSPAPGARPSRRSRAPLSPLGAQEAERARADIAAEQVRTAELASRGPLGRAAASVPSVAFVAPDLLSATAAPAATTQSTQFPTQSPQPDLQPDLLSATTAPVLGSVDQAAHQAATSPQNDLPQPTEPQKHAGNYQKGHVRYAGLDVSIENPRGSKRSGVDPKGKPWEVEMSAAHYGYIRRTEGKDGEQVDVYLASDREDTPVFVVDQVDPKAAGIASRKRSFDEHKVVLGAASREEAEAVYDAAFSDGSGPSRRQAITELPMEGFKAWLKEGSTKKPIASQQLASATPITPPTPTTPTDIPTLPASASPGASQEGAAAGQPPAPSAPSAGYENPPNIVPPEKAVSGGDLTSTTATIPQNDLPLPTIDQQAPTTGPGQVPYQGRTLTVTTPNAVGRRQLVHIDVAKFDAAFAKNTPHYVAPGGAAGGPASAAGAKYQRAKARLDTSDNVETPYVTAGQIGEVGVFNGGDRYAVLRDAGVKTMPVLMDAKSVQNARKAGILAVPTELESQPRATRTEAPAEPQAQGTPTTATTPKGQAVDLRYALVEAADLVVSHDLEGKANPAYPQYLQPRDRSRQASTLQIQRIAGNLAPERLTASPTVSEGAPVIGPDRTVESGNGRVLAIRKAYGGEKGKAYREHLAKNAGQFGLDATAIEAMTAPVLVRARTSNMSDAERAAFARDANESTTARMSPAEEARADAARIGTGLEDYLPSEDGNVLAMQNRGFVKRFLGGLGPEEAAALTTADGAPTKQLGDRIRAAVFFAAYRDERLLSLFAEEADPEIRNVIAALNRAAPEFARARSLSDTLGPYNVIPALVEAADILREARRNNQAVEEAVAQQGLFGAQDPNAEAIALFMDRNKRSAKRLGEGLRAMAGFIEGELRKAGNLALFAETPPTLGEVIARVNQYIEQRYGQENAIDQDLFSQPRRDARVADPRAEGRKPEEDDRAGAEGAEEAKPVTPAYGAANKVFTADAAAAARERLRKKLGTVRIGLDPEMFQDGITLAGFHIEAGARKFGDFSTAMIADLGEKARPYLRAWYKAVKDNQGFDFGAAAVTAEAPAINQPSSKQPAETPGEETLPNFKTGKELDTWLASNVDDPYQLADETHGGWKAKLKDQGVGYMVLAKGKETWTGTSGQQRTTVGGDTRLVFRLKDGRMVWWDHETGDIHDVAEGDPKYKPNPDYQLVQEGISARLRAQETREKETQAEGRWQQLMAAKAEDVPAQVAKLSEDEARGVLARLDAAPGDNPAVRKAINAKLGIVPKPKPAEPAVKPSGPVEDVGEKIGGARKDLWRERGLRLADLDGMSGGEEAQYVTKENVWPAIDYPKLIADGATPHAAALIKIIRDRLAKTPNKDTPEGRRHYVEVIGIAREEMEKAKTTEEVKDVGNKVFARIGWYKDNGWRNDEVRVKAFSVYQGRQNPFQLNWKDTRKADKMLEEGWPAKKNTKTKTQAAREEGKLPERPHLDQIERTGEDRRQGRDIHGEDFLKEFGFRGVEHGLWAAQDERQKALNLAYEALHDLAGTLGMPPKALSLNSTLGLAFGARGSGQFAAHYEPGKLVINLTKLRGAGTLAHEWGHGLDHYFGELDRPDAYQGGARGATGWLGKGRRVKRENLRPEMAVAFDGVMKAIFERETDKAEAVRQQELRLETLQGEIAKGEQRVTKAEQAEHPDKDWLKRMRAWLDDARRSETNAKATLAELRHEPRRLGGYGKVASSYFKEASKLAGTGDYWTRPTELFARAFEAYVFDHIGEQGQVSQYLVQGVEPERYGSSDYKGNPYPVGLERDAINAAFEKLFAAMQTRETEKGTALYSRASQTETPAFKAWFGDSKVVDEKGEPLVVYHGTPTGGFSVFTKKGARDVGWFGGAYYFSGSEDFATTFQAARSRDRSGQRKQQTYAVYLAIRNPLRPEDLTVASLRNLVDASREKRGLEPISDEKWKGYAEIAEEAVADPNPISKSGKLKGIGDIAAMAEAAGYDGIIAKGVEGDTYAVFRPEQIKSATDNVGTFDPANPDMRYSYLGKEAALADRGALAEAIRLWNDPEEEGLSREEIHERTGWYRGKDEQWRFEISDKDAAIKPGWREAKRLGDAFDHPTLYANYPGLELIKFGVKELDSKVAAEAYPKSGHIFLSDRLSEAEVRSVLLHEVQHIVQMIERFAMGGSTRSPSVEKAALERYSKEYNTLEQRRKAIGGLRETWIMDAVRKGEYPSYAAATKAHDEKFPQPVAALKRVREQIGKLGHTSRFQAYQALMGEVEARDVQARRDMTDEERRASEPYVSQGIKEEDFLIDFTGEAAALEGQGPPPGPQTTSRNQKPGPAGLSAIGLLETLAKRFGAGVGLLNQAGTLRIVQHESELPARLNDGKGGIRGVYDRTGDPLTGEGAETAWMVADNLTAAEAPGVFLHELGVHYGLERMIGGEKYHDIIRQMKAMEALGNEAVRAGRAAIPNSTPKSAVDDELLAYLVEKHPELPLVKRIIAAIRAFLFRHGLIKNVRPEDVVALAKAAARHAARGTPESRLSPVYFSAILGKQYAGAPAYSGSPLWYSEMARFLDDKAPGKAPAAQWKSLLEGWAKQGKFKGDELEWSGVKEWLDLQTGPVTKDQVLGFVRENGVRVEETTLGGKEDDPRLLADVEELRRRGFSTELDEEGSSTVLFMNIADPSDLLDLNDLWAEGATQQTLDLATSIQRAYGQRWGRATKHAQWQLPGGENYREVLLRLWDPQAERLAEISKRLKEIYAVPLERWARADEPLTAAEEEVERLTQEQKELRAKAAAGFTSGHYDQPNILAHVRFNERTDADGKRVLFVEEIQSDWAQKGKKEGFKGPERLIDGHDYNWWNKRTDELWAKKTRRESGELKVRPDEQLDSQWSEAADNRDRLAGRPNEVPAAPFVQKTEAWVALVLKRMIRHAAENGFDRIAWTNGEQQAERYDLSKQVQRINTRRIPEGAPRGTPGNYTLDIILRSGDRYQEGQTANVPEKDLEELVGKDLAAKIVKESKTSNHEWTTFKGEDLKVGGEGMRAFYDKIVPNVANGLLKKLGGGRVGTTTLKLDNAPESVVEDWARREPDHPFVKKNRSVQPGFDLTPELRASAMRGLPLFARGAQTDTPAFRAWFGDSVLTDTGKPGGKPKVVYHGTADSFSEFELERPNRKDTGWLGEGFYFTNNRDTANAYTVMKGGTSPNVMPVYLKITNPYRATVQEKERIMLAERGDREAARRRTKELIEQGYDGIALDYGDYSKGETEYVVFRPEQIKSATGNVGTFDPTNPDIRYSRATPPGPAPDPNTPEGAAEQLGRIGEAMRTTRHGWEAVKSKVVEDWRPARLALATRRQLVDIGQGMVPELADYDRAVQAMDADRNQLDGETHEVAEIAETYVQAHPKEADEFFDLLHSATLAGTDPAETFRPSINRGEAFREMASLRRRMRTRPGEADVLQGQIDEIQVRLDNEKVRKAAHPGLARRYAGLSQDAKVVYARMRDLYMKRFDERETALIERIRDTEADERWKARLIADIKHRFETARLSAPYFPLTRFGDFWVAAVNPDGEREFHLRESAHQMKALTEDLERAGYHDIASGRKIDTLFEQQGASAEFVTEVIKLLDRGTHISHAARADLKDAIYQMYLQSLPELSTRRHWIHRKKTPGFSKDAVRGFAKHMFHGNRQLAVLRQQTPMEKALADARKREKFGSDPAHEPMEQALRDMRKAKPKGDPELVALEKALNAARKAVKDRLDPVRTADLINEMQKRDRWIKNPQVSSFAYRAGSLGFLWYLTAPASAIVNVTQTPLVAYPLLAARHGWVKSAAALNRAAVDFFKGRFSVEGALQGEELAAYKRFLADAVIDKTQTHDLAGMAETPSGSYSGRGAKAMRAASWMFHRAEVMNREITALAAYRLARADGVGIEAAYQQAKTLTFEAHFDYSTGNKPRFLQNDAARVLLMFKQFSQHMIYLLGCSAQQSVKGLTPAARSEARTRLTGLLGMHALFAGALGMPLMDTLATVMNALFDDEDEPWDFELELRNFFADVFGPEIGQAIVRGPVESLTGLGIASRVGLSDLLFREPDKSLEGRGLVEWWSEQLLGPLGGIALKAGTAYDLFQEGHTTRALESMTPTAIRSGLQMLRYAGEGAQSLRGDPVMEDVSTWNLAGQFLGFSPAKLGQKYDANRALKDLEQRTLDRRERLIGRWWLARRHGDLEGVREAMAEIGRFNGSSNIRENPRARITPATLLASMQQRRNYSRRAEGGVIVDRRLSRLEERVRFGGAPPP